MKENNLSRFEQMTKTPVQKLILRLSVPTVLSMMSTTIYNLVDTAFVGTLGNSASGAVGVVFGFMAILQAIGFMFGQGCGSILARRLGSKDPEGASETASTGFFFSFLFGILVSIVCALLLDPLIAVLGSTDTIAPYAKTYIYYILSTAPFVVSSFTLNNILRYEGKAALGMIGLISGGLLNIAGDAIFMFGLHMDIAGAGLSTALSQVISFGILLFMFLSGRTACKLSFRKIRFRSLLVFRIMWTGLPSLLRQSLGSIGTILLNQESAACAGDAGVAAMSIVGKIAFFLFAIALGVGQGFQPVCGFNYGAGKYSRIRSGYRFTLLFSIAVMIVLTIPAMIFAEPIVWTFRHDSQVAEIGTRALRLLCVAQIFLPICMVTEMLMQSSGKSLSASILSALRGGALFIPALIILKELRGMAGVQEAQPVAFLLSIPLAIWFARSYFRTLPPEDREGEDSPPPPMPEPE